MAARVGILSILLDEAQRVDNLKRRRQARRIRSMQTISRDSDYIRNYRLSLDLIHALEADIAPYLPRSQKSTGICNELKIRYFLSFLAKGDYQRGVGQNVETYVSQATGSRILHQVLDAINNRNVVAKYIRFPQNVTERETLKERFYTKFGIPGIIGSVDGTLVPIVRPARNEEFYYCRKGYHARNVLIISDADLNILHLDATFGGATHDSYVFNNCPIKRHLEELNESGEVVGLLGDSGYPQRPYLMTPFHSPEPGSCEENYNKLHGTARNSVERALGVLKGRFRCLLLQRSLQYDPITASQIIIACCVLHNMCNRAGLPAPVLSPAEEAEENRLRQMLAPTQPRLAGEDGLANGRRCRDRLASQLWRYRRE